MDLIILRHYASDDLYSVEWLLYPVCKNKTRIRIRGDTILENFPLFCPKCKQETLIRVRQLNMSVIAVSKS